MVSLKLDTNNNLIFSNNFATVSGVEAVAQDIKNLLMLFITEYPFDTTIGLDYYELASQNNQTLIKNAIIERVMQDDRILSVQAIEVNFSNMNMNITLQAILKTGEVVNV